MYTICLIFLLFLLVIYIKCTKVKLTGGSKCNSAYRFTRYPKFCCDIDPIPMTKIPKLQGLDNDTKFLYKVMSDPSMRMIVSFDKSIVVNNIIYRKKISSIDEQHGRNIFYQLAIMNNYPIQDYPRKSNYDIYVYFINKKDAKDGFVTTNFYNTVVGAKLMLNKNSIEVLKYQNLDRFNAYRMKDSRSMLNTFINILNEDFSLAEQENIICYHGIIAYYLGLRPTTDIDCTTNDSKIYKTLKKYDWIDPVNLRVPAGKEFWIQGVLNNTKLKSFDEIMYNPKNYMYILGIKCFSLDINMVQRYYRQRPKAVGEIVTFNILNNKQYPIPPIPKIYILSNRNTQITELEIELFKFKDTQHPIDKKRYLGTMLYYLKSLYKINKFNNIHELEEYLIKSSL